MSVLEIPEPSLVVLIGISGSGKSTFAAEHFGAYEVISSDHCRGLVSDDPNSKEATVDAFEVLEFIATKRMRAGKLTVIDATSVQPAARKKLIDLARSQDVLPVAIVLNLPEQVCAERNAARGDRGFDRSVLRRQHQQLSRSMRGLAREGFRTVHVLDGVEDVASARIVRQPLRSDRRDLPGPFDVIGDIHGCLGELETLLGALGYTVRRDEQGRPVDALPPAGRTAVFVGDYVDRGPDSPGVLRLVMGMAAAGHALALPGNHENKLVKALRGQKVNATHGLDRTLEQLASESEEFRRAVADFCDGLVAHLVLDDGRLVVAHAGLKEEYHNRASGRVRSFALYGETTGETDEFGLPVRYPWAEDYRGDAMVLYGHTPVPDVRWLNNTACLDTGCVFGGALTAMRYPEREVVSVPADREWYPPAKPLHMPEPDPQALDIEDILRVGGVDTALRGRITIRPENAAGALEVMSRWAVAPQWLHYLPPTMAPCATSSRPGLLEHPAEAFAEYRKAGVSEVICEEKHMGSRAIVMVCRDASVVAARFGVTDGLSGMVHTRTGRRMFDEEQTERLVTLVAEAVGDAGLWEELGTDWMLLDAELLPWSAKSEGLLRSQYAAVGAAARADLAGRRSVLEASAERGLDVGDLLERVNSRAADVARYTDAYRRYVWPTDGLDGVRVAPFQVLATEGAGHSDRDHGWHLAIADRLVAAAPTLFTTTRRVVVDTGSPESEAAGIAWWDELTGAGGEGMVVKPLANGAQAGARRVQPGIKVRGREYLRLIYGPHYTEKENLERLRNRNLGHKQSMALREYALGMEAVDRLVRADPLWRIHQAVFAVLALESEAVDPRL
ncbi:MULTISPECIES: polynucleotide kinase-phosphatase [Rhodococcus]|uniref:polynucleotide kinase-phosphatase n=1 Tax=Rhodococcus TaxID=1827 RepID=UPI001AE1DECE|nr:MULTISPECIES: polynucleotide kinase-phosphatase [Rhodococcus]MBP1158160.1 polynucleotide kinase-phosphatase [Rhodococcus sp. PvR099]MCZ4554239.1 polynucleotide kinase-phosphatase [Rhodococcus maanshanensis]